MAETLEAQEVGQLQIDATVADVTGLTEDQIGERIDSDPAFAKAYAAGRIADRGAVGQEADAQAAEAAKAAEAAAASTPARAPQAPAAKPDPAGGQVFTVKRGELPEGFDTPGKVFKSLVDKQNYIDQIKNQVDVRDQRIRDLEARLNAEQKAKEEATAAAQARASVQVEEIDDAKIYDPEFLKAQLKRIQGMDRLEKELAELRAKVGKTEDERKAQESVSQEIRELRKFQDAHPTLKTARNIEEINADYLSFIDGIAQLTGAEPADTLGYVGVYLNDKTENGDNLRAAAAKAGLRLPDDFEPYQRIITVRQAARENIKIDARGNQRNFTLDEALRLTFPEIIGKAAPAAPAGRPASAQELKVREREEMRLAAERLEQDRAAEVPPAQSGKGLTVEDLSDQQIDELMALSPEQLRANPNKKKMLDMIYEKLNLPLLNVNGINQ